MTSESADKLRTTINKIQDMRNDLTQIYNTCDDGVMLHLEARSLLRAIEQMDISLRKMGKRLLTERINLT